MRFPLFLYLSVRLRLFVFTATPPRPAPALAQGRISIKFIVFAGKCNGKLKSGDNCFKCALPAHALESRQQFSLSAALESRQQFAFCT